MKKCNECHSVNNSNAKYCRCCGVVLENILKLYPKMRLVPTNFYDWRKPKVGMLLKMFLMLPIILQTTDPIDMLGLLRGVYWVSGTRDLAAEQTFECEGVSYIAFDTKQYRDNNSYFCIKME